MLDLTGTIEGEFIDFLSSPLLNMTSLPNKIDELTTMTRHQRKYTILMFMETCLITLITDETGTLNGFTLISPDRTMSM